MASTIKVKRSAVSGNAPNTSNIDTGELALNTADGILYSTDGSTVFEVGANLTSLAVSGQVTLTNIISANGGLGTAGQALLTDGSSKVYWGTVASGSSSGAAAGIRTSYYYTANEGDTTFTGADDNANVANLDRAYVDVFVNGILISPTNYTSNTTAVVFTSGVSNNDIVTLLASDVVAGDVAKTYVYSANGTQTIFDGADLDGQTLTITTEHYDVYVNGLLIWDNANNYTSNSSAVEFTTTLADNDIVTIKTYEIAPGRAVLTGIDDNSTAVAVTIDSSNRVGINETTPNYNLDVGGSLGVNSLYIGDVQVTASAAEINLLDGLTANTSELNLLDGVTATTAEINYLDGVTSNIQTQIDNISSSFTLAADNGANDTFNTDETLTFTGGTGIDTTVANNEITIAIDSTVGTITSSTGAAIIPSGTTAQRDGSPVAGYLRFNTSDSSFEGYDGSAWGAIGGTATTNHLELDDISGSFDGANTNFSLTVSSSAVSPTSAAHLLISINGIVQEPTTVYTVSGSTITFTTAPQSGDTFFGVFYESLNIGTPGNGTVGTAQLSSANIAFDTSTLFIDSTNNRVGVGTTSPSTALDVLGDITLSGNTNFADGGRAVFGAGSDLQIYHDGSHSYISDQGTGNLRIAASDRIQFYNAATDEVTAQFIANGEAELRYDNTTRLATTSTGIDVTGGVSIDDDNNFSFGDGTTYIQGSGAADRLKFITNASEAMRIDSSGNVGIGTSSPVYKLDVAGDASFESGKILINEITGADAYSEIRKTNTGSNFVMSSPESIYMLIDSNNDQTNRGFYVSHGGTSPTTSTPLFVVQEGGNVGIGTTSVTGKLNVKSTYSSGTTVQQRFEDNTGAALDFGGTASGEKWLNAADTGTPSTGYPILFRTGGTERLRIQAGGGISFNGDTAAANALDDYEEGTWTPVDVNDTAYNTNGVTATYTKVGRIVYFNFDISSTGSTTGTKLGGLPFTAASSSVSNNWSVYTGYSTSNADICGHINAGTDEVNITVGSSAHTLAGRWIGAGFYYV